MNGINDNNKVVSAGRFFAISAAVLNTTFHVFAITERFGIPPEPYNLIGMMLPSLFLVPK